MASLHNRAWVPFNGAYVLLNDTFTSVNTIACIDRVPYFTNIRITDRVTYSLTTLLTPLQPTMYEKEQNSEKKLQWRLIE